MNSKELTQIHTKYLKGGFDIEMFQDYLRKTGRGKVESWIIMILPEFLAIVSFGFMIGRFSNKFKNLPVLYLPISFLGGVGVYVVCLVLTLLTIYLIKKKEN
tara:strand:+ start:6970 stop:7275 length:306 start_codon:yes stop_codon:yes gene_type:complete